MDGSDAAPEPAAAFDPEGAVAGDPAPPDPLVRASALIVALDEALRRTIAASPACPYCQVPTYLRRHHAGCGVEKALLDAKAWLAGQA